MGLADYLSLIRFKSHFAYLEVVVPALFFAQSVSFDLVKSLILLYISFTIFLYGGLYTLNGVVDVEEDSKHPVKRLRLLPSGRISRKSALIFSGALIAAGFFSGFWLFGVKALYCYVAFTALNFFYSFAAKRIPFLEILHLALTHTLRSLMAFYLFNYEIPILVVIALLPFHFGLGANLRELELENRGIKARQVLKHYKPVHFRTIHALVLITLILFFLADKSGAKVLYIPLLAYYLISVFFIKLLPKRIRCSLAGV